MIHIHSSQPSKWQSITHLICAISCYCILFSRDHQSCESMVGSTSSGNNNMYEPSRTILPIANAFVNVPSNPVRARTTQLFSLKPAAIPLMDSGESEFTRQLLIYILSNSEVRNVKLEKMKGIGKANHSVWVKILRLLSDQTLNETGNMK
mmetsp:Transcript_27318/g.46469  ORF Transcript_27318/g.46469 Transcript_27318/m.46469 type:complete len:150 (-) Transcript_27318:69-518(-)